MVQPQAVGAVPVLAQAQALAVLQAPVAAAVQARAPAADGQIQVGNVINRPKVHVAVHESLIDFLRGTGNVS